MVLLRFTNSLTLIIKKPIQLSFRFRLFVWKKYKQNNFEVFENSGW